MMIDLGLSLSTILSMIWSGVFVVAFFVITHWALQQPDAQSEVVRRLTRAPTTPAKPRTDWEHPHGGTEIEILVVDTTELERDLRHDRSKFAQAAVEHHQNYLRERPGRGLQCQTSRVA